MSPLLRSVLLLVVVTTLAAAANQDKYTVKYDSVNLDQILNNNRLLTSYIKCLMDQGPCTPDGEELKRPVLNNKYLRSICSNILNKCSLCDEHFTTNVTLPGHVKDALETNCKKCSTKQREGIEKVARFLIKNKPKEFSALEKKYDPKGVYRAKYQGEAQKKGIKI